jgi:ABC-type dipeptide/oligopeptide/nickel transport system ATPase component
MRARQTQETLTQQEAEAVKLEQRLAAAREQYDSGLSKLRSTARELERLSAQVRGCVFLCRCRLFCERMCTKGTEQVERWPMHCWPSAGPAACKSAVCSMS